MSFMVRPPANEYFEYYERYISLVPDGDIIETLRAQFDKTTAYLSALSEEQGAFRYAPGKWSVKEALGHLIDTERIFAYRALRIARNDRTPIEGFEQDDYVRFGSFDACTLASLIAEFAAVRKSTELLFAHLADEAWARMGVAYDHEVSVRALAYIAAGHELHHLAVLRAKYFPQ
jgi:hypothetical protein